MKNLIHKTLVLIASVIIGVVVNFTSLNSTANAQTITASFCSATGVTDKDVIGYLEGFGYKDVVVLETYENGDRLCKADCQCLIMVYVEGEQIVGHEEIDQ